VDSPEVWQWIWLATALVFGLGEMATAGSFFLLPFGLGAAVAAALAFVDVSVGWEWTAFLAISAVSFAALRPISKRLDASLPSLGGVGADRWTGRSGVVLDAIPQGPGELGQVRVDREEWRAASHDGVAIAVGTQIEVVRVEGTRVVVKSQEG